MNEQRIDKLARILQDVSTMGGMAETTKIVTNLEVTDAAPSVTTVPAGYIIVENDQGFNVPAQEVPGVSYADGDLVNVLYVKGSEPVAMQQGSSSPSSNLWEIVPATTTDIFYDGGLVGINNPTPAENLDVLGSVVVDTNVFYIDDVNDFVGFGIIVSNASQQISVLMDANKDILIDGTTNPRNVDTGVMRFEQTPAITDTRALTVNMDINSQVNSHALVVNLVATQLQTGESVSAYDINIDTANASGGIVRGFEVSCAGAGTVDGCHALHVDPNVSPIFHLSGSFISVEQAWQDDGGFVDTTAAFNGAPDINIFVNNGAVCYWGMAATFDQIEVVLNTVASGPGIKPTFEFSDGIGGWAVFTPSDESQGFRQNGIISWTITDLVGWAVDTVNAVANKYWIRITRTQVALTTPPNEETLLVAITTEYFWDEDALVSISRLGVNTPTPDATVEIVDTTEQLRLTHTDGSKYVSFTVNTNHDLTIKPTSTGQIILQSTTDQTNFFQVLDADGGAPVLNVDTINERVGVGIALPTVNLDVIGNIRVAVDGDSFPAINFERFNAGAFTNRKWQFVLGTGGEFFIQDSTAGINRTIIDLNGRYGVGPSGLTPAGQIHIDQGSLTAAIPVAYFDQADVSEEMFEFATTIGIGNAIEAVGAKALTTTHFIKVTIPGGLTRYFPVGTIA